MIKYKSFLNVRGNTYSSLIADKEYKKNTLYTSSWPYFVFNSVENAIKHYQSASVEIWEVEVSGYLGTPEYVLDTDYIPECLEMQKLFWDVYLENYKNEATLYKALRNKLSYTDLIKAPNGTELYSSFRMEERVR